MPRHARCFSAFDKPVSEVKIGVPRETFQNENRVALSPEAAQRLIKQGFQINLEKGAGERSDFNDEHYTSVGVNIVDSESVWKSDLLLKVRAPHLEEVDKMDSEAGLISMMHPAQN